MTQVLARLAALAMMLASAACVTLAPVGSIGSVRAIDEGQRAMVAAADVEGLGALAHANLRINAPTGRVLDRAQFLAGMRSGGIAAERFERTAEDVSISGNVAVVIGREMFTPTADSELGRTYGAVPLLRRYTNVYLWENGRWYWLARQAAVVSKR